MDNGINWTDDRVEKLKRLWSEGLSASQIATQLGGVSRNAVIGKVHRLSLPGRAKAGGATSARSQKRATVSSSSSSSSSSSQSRPATYTAPRTITRTVTRPVGATMLKEEVEIEVTEEMVVATSNVVVPIFKRLPLVKLTERTCKWPLGDPLKDDFSFCGNDSPDNTPYCTYHQKLAYQPSAERRRVR